MLTARATLLVLALAMAGCSRNPPPPLDPAAPTMVRVDNQSFADMNIFVVYRGQRQRLGMATGGSVTNFRIPVRIMSAETLQFIADPIGGSRLPVSDEILVVPGDTVMLTIPPR